jgi:hypothetical protein
MTPTRDYIVAVQKRKKRTNQTALIGLEIALIKRTET